MPIYIIDTSTDEIVARFAVGGSAREIELLADDENRTRVDDPGDYNRDDHIYKDGAFQDRPDPSAAEQLIAAASAKKKELADEAQEFVYSLSSDELAAVQAVDPSRTYERYPGYWILWAGGQNNLAQLIAAHPSATAEQLARAEAVKLAFWHVQYWISLVTSEPVEAAYVELEAAVAAGDIDAVKYVTLDLSDYKIGSGSDKADPDKTRPDLYLPPQDIVLLGPAAV